MTATIFGHDAIRIGPIPVTMAGKDVIRRTGRTILPGIPTIGMAIVASGSCRNPIPMMPTTVPK
jgi:hypothetical protein